MHDWPEKEILRILSSVRAAMQASAQPCTLCLVEVGSIASMLAADHRSTIHSATTSQNSSSRLELDAKSGLEHTFAAGLRPQLSTAFSGTLQCTSYILAHTRLKGSFR